MSSDQSPSEWLLERFDQNPRGILVRGLYNPTKLMDFKDDKFCRSDDPVHIKCLDGPAYWYASGVYDPLGNLEAECSPEFKRLMKANP